MLSRVAENLYWMARYLERSENTARLINAHTNALLDLPRGMEFGWNALIDIMGCREEFDSIFSVSDERNVVKFLIADERNPSSIVSSLSSARAIARTLREVLQRELWEELNALYLYAKQEMPNSLGRRKRFEAMRQVIRGRQTVLGITDGTMSRDEGFQFFRLGRYSERSDMTSRIVDTHSAQLLGAQSDELPFENIRWINILRSLSAYQMYRQHVHVRVRGPEVLRFLIQDWQFPRSFTFGLHRCSECLAVLPSHDMALRVLGRLQRRIDEADMYELASEGLHEFVDELQLGLGELHAAVSTTYFRQDKAISA